MSVLGLILMWVWLAVAFAILNQWPMGKESGRRQAYWARYEGK
jgi:hypothetical protein